MKPVIEFGDCMRDSPKFRSGLEEQIARIDNLDGKLEKLLKCSNSMIDSGKTFLNSQHTFFNCLTEVSVHFRHDAPVYSAFSKCSSGLIELSKFQSTLLDQINRAICRNLADFLKKEVRSCKEMRSYLDKLQQEYENALVRNSSIPKGKNTEAEEALHAVSAARVNFRSAALDIVYQISLLQQRKRFEILDNIVSVMNAHKTFFHQGSDFFKDTDPFLKKLSGELSDMRSNVAKDADKMLESRQILIHSTLDYVSGNSPGSTPGLSMQGYLFRRGSTKTFKTWKRRWFELHSEGQLNYRKRHEETPTVVEDDLRICLVRPMADCDRRFCFELISPNKTHILQADCEEIFQAWVAALQAAISSAIHNSTSARKDDNLAYSPPSQSESSTSNLLRISPEKSKVLKSILSVKGNTFCCDCRAPKPEWASVNLGITLCIQCSGIHRSLGVHYSKVKSLNLDTWESGAVKLMGDLGNDLVNRIYLAKVNVMDTLGIEKATPDCSGEIRVTWIKAKYVDRAFVTQPMFTVNGKVNKESSKWVVRKPLKRHHSPSGSNQFISSDDTAGNSLTVEEDKIRGMDENSESESLQSFQSKDTSSAATSDAETTLVPCSDLPPSHTDVVITSANEDESTEETDYNELTDVMDADRLLYKAARVGNLGVMCEAIALGADKNWHITNNEKSTPLHQAVLGGSVSACEFLLLNGSRINTQDARKRTPLWLATQKGHTGQVCLFLRNRADYHIADEDGKIPLDVAMASEHADIVTLLRLAQMDEEMGENNQADDTFQEIVRDIALRAKDGTDSPVSNLNINMDFGLSLSPSTTLTASPKSHTTTDT